MFKNVILYSLLPILAFSVWGDQLADRKFREIFPFVTEEALWKLTNGTNYQNTTKLAIDFLNEWIDENWIEPPTTQSPGNVIYYKLVDKEFCRNLAIEFIEHRQAVKKYIRYLYRTTLILNYFTESEAEIMRARFWRSDRFCTNDFKCVKEDFFDETYGVVVDFGSTHGNVTTDLLALVDPLEKLPEFGDKLNYVFRKA